MTGCGHCGSPDWTFNPDGEEVCANCGAQWATSGHEDIFVDVNGHAVCVDLKTTEQVRQ